MCVIGIYEKGLELNKEELRACFAHNPDGAGYMIQTAKGVHIEKGFFSFNSFWNAVKNLPVDKDRVLHFRIATSGKISVNCCHPFPVTSDYKKMAMAKTDSLMGFAHNGVLQDFTPKAGMKSNKSDTMVFNHDVLSKVAPILMKGNEGLQELLELYTPSRFAVMDSKKVLMLGDWYNSPQSGAWYSNTSYESRSSLIEEDWEEDWDVDQYFKIPDTGYSDKQLEAIAGYFEETYGVYAYDWVKAGGDIIFTYQPGTGDIPKCGRIGNIEFSKVVVIDE